MEAAVRVEQIHVKSGAEGEIDIQFNSRVPMITFN